MAKGSNFEREICRTLSMWYSEGADDSWFWRTSISGGRATVRSKQGKVTQGAYGDITATCPAASSLTAVLCLELKVGYGDWSVQDCIDARKDGTRYDIDDFLDQTLEQSKAAKTKFGVLIFKKDRRDVCVCFQSGLYERLAHYYRKPELDRYITFRRNEHEDPWIIMKLDKFLQWAKPEYFKNAGSTTNTVPTKAGVRFTRAVQ